MNHLPIEFRDIAAEIQDEELARSKRQEQILRSEPYLQGWFDAADGIPHTDKGPDYNRGYNHRYAKEQEDAS